MSRTAAKFTQADVARSIRAAKQAGAARSRHRISCHSSRQTGPNTPAGHRCSNIMEMLGSPFAKPADIARQVRELAELTN